MQALVERVRALTGCSTVPEDVEQLRSYLKAALRVSHPDKHPGAPPERIAVATATFCELRACQEELGVIWQRASFVRLPPVKVHVPVDVLRLGGTVSVNVAIRDEFRTVVVPVARNSIPPCGVTVELPEGHLLAELVDAIDPSAVGAPRRRPGTLDLEVDCVIGSREMLQGGGRVGFRSALVGGQFEVEMPPFSLMCGEACRPSVVFRVGGIEGQNEQCGDLIVHVTAAPGVGFFPSECGDIFDAINDVAEMRRKLRFYEEALGSPRRPPRRVLRPR